MASNKIIITRAKVEDMRELHTAIGEMQETIDSANTQLEYHTANPTVWCDGGARVRELKDVLEGATRMRNWLKELEDIRLKKLYDNISS